MGKILEGLLLRKKPSKKDIKSLIQKTEGGEKKVNYVLITCTEPNDEGTMEVEMRYEGEKKLIAYLIHSAKEALEKDAEGY